MCPKVNKKNWDWQHQFQTDITYVYWHCDLKPHCISLRICIFNLNKMWNMWTRVTFVYEKEVCISLKIGKSLLLTIRMFADNMLQFGSFCLF